MGASPGEVIGVIKVNGKPYGSVIVLPGSKPGKRLKMQVPHPPGSKVSFDYAAGTCRLVRAPGCLQPHRCVLQVGSAG